ncbi:MAG: oxygen-independent coproporphyrinogen III oxidase [Magnetospiraceae bacterium]
MNIDELATKYDLRIPRYTSYPTAPHFQPVENDSQYRDWLGTLDRATRPSLYVHIPFCDSMCWFCGCYTKIVKRHEPVMDYVSSVLAEIALVAKQIPETLDARHLHFGGGSPTMMTPDEFAHVIGTVGQHFDIGGDAEIAVELDPRTATADYVAGLAKAGVNRASIGVQDFDDKVQQAINRIQPFDVTKRVVEWLNANGINRINMDLMYGLPHQTTELVLDMVDKAVTLNPVRFALFGYAHVPWMKSHMKMIHEEDLPDTVARWHQYEAASARLQEHGYLPVGLDHFARPDDELAVALVEDRLHRNFQGYTTDEAQVMIGFGASAIGQLDQGFTQNKLPLKDYRNDVAEGRLPVGKMLAFQGDDKLRGALIEELMCSLSVDVDAVAAKFGGNAADYDPDLEKLLPLREDGLLTIEGRKVTVTEPGRALVRLAATVFDAYLEKGQKRHSKAV